jgi:hypothetical protein
MALPDPCWPSHHGPNIMQRRRYNYTPQQREVLTAIPHTVRMVELDLKSVSSTSESTKSTRGTMGYTTGDNATPVRDCLWGSLSPRPSCRDLQLTWPDTPVISTRFSIVTYLGDWPISGENLQAADIVRELKQLGLTLNIQKSALTPTSSLIYLGLAVNTFRTTIQPTAACLQHLQHLLTLVPQASQQKLLRIAGYVSWLAWAMGWPQFLAADIRHWLRVLLNGRPLHPPLGSLLLQTGAPPYSIATLAVGPPRRTLLWHYQQPEPIAFAEMAAELAALIWIWSRMHNPTNVTLYTDSAVVCHTLRNGTGQLLWTHELLQNMYIRWVN